MRLWLSSLPALSPISALVNEDNNVVLQLCEDPSQFPLGSHLFSAFSPGAVGGTPPPIPVSGGARDPGLRQIDQGDSVKLLLGLI